MEQPTLFDNVITTSEVSYDKFTIDELFKRSLKYKNSKEFIKFFQFIASFNHYSRYNTMLVYIQNPEVTFFGGTTFWRHRGRSINIEAKPLLILCPNGPMMCVYDIFDTSGKATPLEYLNKGSGNSDIEGVISQKIYDNTIKQVKNWGINLAYKPLSFFKGGFITTLLSGKLDIVLKENATKEENFSVLIHELAHLFLGHTGHSTIKNSTRNKEITLLQRKYDKTTRELEAETVSYLICSKLGLKTTSAEYLGVYIRNESDLLNFNFELVIKIADKIESFIK